MALPKKKSIRKIIVDNETYYWRISSQDTNNHDLITTIGLVDDPNKRFFLKFKHIDKMEILNTLEYEKLKEFKNEIDIVTPSIIEEAIKAAIDNDWSSRGYKDLLNIRLSNGIYTAEK